jgi:hypothetical protein
MFLIVCIAAIIAVFISLISIWACSLAAFISIIAIVYMLNDYFEDRSIKAEKRKHEIYEAEVAQPIDESYPYWHHEPEASRNKIPDAGLKPVSHRSSMIRNYMELFELDEERSAKIYDAGYKNLTRLRSADLNDLISINGINPTVARRIQNYTRGVKRFRGS